VEKRTDSTVAFQSSDRVRCASVEITRDALGVITSTDETVFELLGWRPDQIIGSPSTTLIHPADQPGAVAAWMDMISSPGSSRIWRGRYKTAYGSWRWVETANCFQDGDAPRVVTQMSAVSSEEASLEEQFQAREQLLNQLSDALPVGVFQVDLEGHITLTNKSFHLIVGVPPQTSLQEQMSNVCQEDLPALSAALAEAFACKSVDGVEIRLRVPTGESPPVTMQDRVCLLGLRPLTDGAGLVNGAVGCLSDVTDRAVLHQELEIRAAVDELTSCFNRAATIELVDRTVNARHDGLGRAVVFVDLDGLKTVNDELGHSAGDRLLVAAADRIRSALGNGDSVGRLGGDEFLVVCPRVVSSAQAMETAKRISAALTTSLTIGANEVQLRASIGVVWTIEALDTDSLIARADSAMYESKRLGDHGVTLFADADVNAHRAVPAGNGLS
jgi:diguanylate cyclase (GGDEF)-like protein/PAS domain S-box-containing protein